MLDFSILTNNMDLYLEGFKYTIIASLIALVASFVLGTIIAVMRIAPLKIVNVIGTVYVEFIRNIPLVVIVFLFLLWQESAVQQPECWDSLFIRQLLSPKLYERELWQFQKGSLKRRVHPALRTVRRCDSLYCLKPLKLSFLLLGINLLI